MRTCIYISKIITEILCGRETNMVVLICSVDCRGVGVTDEGDCRAAVVTADIISVRCSWAIGFQCPNYRKLYFEGSGFHNFARTIPTDPLDSFHLQSPNFKLWFLS